MSDEQVRLTISISKEDHKKFSKIRWGLRSELVKIVLSKIVDSAEKHGQAIYGFILDGEFDIVPRKKK